MEELAIENDIFKTIDSLYPIMVEIRRYLHQNPELSFQEFETAKYIANVYKELAIPYKMNVGGNGVIAVLEGGKPGKTVALRADFDALPIHDEKKVPYKSKVDGVMHACGHDGHTAILLTLAKAVTPYRDTLPGNLVFLHQHAEELMPGGAKSIVESGVLKQVDAVFGTHLWATTPLGTLQTRNGIFMAGMDRFEITINGKGGHGGYPHETKDAIVIGTNIVSSLQQILSRRLNPLTTAVITVGEFKGGSAFNVIAERVKLTGTVRYLDVTIRDQIVKEMEKIISGVCESFDASYTFDYEKGYPPLVNHDKEVKLILNAGKDLNEIEKIEEVDPQMGGEDFAYYLLEKPGAFFFTGAQKEGQTYPHHHPKFDFDERALPIAAKALMKIYLKYQKANL